MSLDYTPNLREELRSQGITNEGELTYCVNKITNALRYADNPESVRISVDGQKSEQYARMQSYMEVTLHEDSFKLHSGKIVKFGFNFGF